MTLRASERRKVARFSVHVPIDVSQIGRGSTIDVSATGVSFLIDRELQPGLLIQFELALDDGKSLVACDGRIVRVEKRDSVHFTAATIDTIAVVPAIEH